jgi:RNA polymerase sigma factor (sigma-70 family)
MATPATTAVLKVIRSATHADSVGISDRELLRRFTEVNDQAAFAVLFRRHAGMVLGVCRRALPTVQDAEDACQATFLILARKAKGKRWQASIANWLYTSARQVAWNARVAAQRRARREARVAVPEAVSPVDRMTGRELLAALDEELDRLPPRYREPLVLCYLEGLTRDEAAAHLGIPEATLKVQLERGRKRLGDALTRRGCFLGTGLLAMAATSPTGASPSRLVPAVLAGVSGQPPAAVAALAERVAVNGVVTKSLVGGLLLLGAAALGIGMGSVVLTAAGPRPDPPASAPAAATNQKAAPVPAEQEAVVVGRVLAPDGKPLAGAKLLLLGKDCSLVDRGTTAADGRFAVKVPKTHAGAYLVARADGVGLDFIDLAGMDPKTPIELRAVAEQVIRGRLIDTEGKAVPGASVQMHRLGTSRDNSLDPILAEWKKLNVFSASPAGEKQIWSGTGALYAATTDRDGRFEFHGVGAERLVVLRLSGAGFTEVEAYIATRKGLDANEYNQAVLKNAQKGFGGGKPRWQLYGPDFGVVVEREKPIRGRVTDVNTGQPRAGVHVIHSRNGSDLLQVPLGAWTDKNGTYEIRGARKSSRYMVEIESDPATGYMACQGWVEDGIGYDPVTIDLRAKKGVIVTGRMLDQGTNKPVAGFVMIGVPQGNPFIKDYPNFSSSAWMGGVETAADGTFRAVTIPGPVLLMGGPNTLEEQGRYQRPAADPKYPQLFKAMPGHTAYVTAGGGISPLQGNFCKVLEIKPDARVVEQDVVLTPLKPGK